MFQFADPSLSTIARVEISVFWNWKKREHKQRIRCHHLLHLGSEMMYEHRDSSIAEAIAKQAGAPSVTLKVLFGVVEFLLDVLDASISCVASAINIVIQPTQFFILFLE
jgi:hypothetical protein